MSERTRLLQFGQCGCHLAIGQVPFDIDVEVVLPCALLGPDATRIASSTRRGATTARACGTRPPPCSAPTGSARSCRVPADRTAVSPACPARRSAYGCSGRPGCDWRPRSAGSAGGAVARDRRNGRIFSGLPRALGVAGHRAALNRRVVLRQPTGALRERLRVCADAAQRHPWSRRASAGCDRRPVTVRPSA